MSKATVAAAVFLVSLSMQRPAGGRIVLDGEFDDWTTVPIAVSDPGDAPSSAIDLREVRVAADPQWLSVLIDFGRVALLSQVPGSVVILLDEDGDAATGRTAHGLSGIDVEITPSWTQRAEAVRRTTGPAGRGVTNPDDGLPVQFAPKWESDRIEVRIGRRQASSGSPLLEGRRATLKVVYVLDGRTIDDTSSIAIELPPFEAPRTLGIDERTPPDDPLARRGGATLRVATWNVLGFQRQKPWEKVAQILQAVDADLWLLTELSVKSPEQVTGWLPRGTADAPAWRVSLKGELAIAARGSIDDVFAEPMRPPATTFYDSLWEIFLGRSAVSASGAVARISNRRVFTAPLHLACCGAVLVRAEESRVLHEAIRASLPGVRPDGVVIGGDFNTLRNLVPIETLRAGSDVDGSSLEVVRALQLDGLSAMTFRPKPRGDAALGASHLDWILYSGSSLELTNAFVFDSSDLSPYWLRHHRLAKDASDSTSDHLPVVADFKWRR